MQASRPARGTVFSSRGGVSVRMPSVLAPASSVRPDGPRGTAGIG